MYRTIPRKTTLTEIGSRPIIALERWKSDLLKTSGEKEYFMNTIHQQEMEQLRVLFRQEAIDRADDRIRILEVFLDTEEHVTCAELIALLNKKDYDFEPDFVRETLKLLACYGFVQENKFELEESTYEHRHLGYHHDHLICTRCQKIVEFEDDDLEALQLQIASQYGFHMLQHKMEIYGLCSDCINKREPSVSIASAREGEWVQIKEFLGGSGIQNRLASLGIRVGDEVELLTNSGKGPLVLAHNCSRLAVGRGIAKKIMIIPGGKEKGQTPGLRLSRLKEGQKATIVRVGGASAFRRRLMEMGFLKGTEIQIEKYAPLQDPMELILKGYHISLRVCEASQIVVKKVQGNQT
jgi:Fur family ferric uptake transcriptional regulator